MSGKTKTMKTKDGRTIPIIEPENKFIKRKPTKKEMQEDRAKNRPSRNITGDRAKQRKRKKLVRDTITAGLLGVGLGRKFGVENQFMQQQKPLGEVGKKTGDMILSPKADLDGDGMFSEYEKKRGMAVQKAMAKEKVETASLGKAISSKIPEMMSRFQADAQAKKAEEEKMFQEMVKREKAKYGNTQQMKEGGIAKGGGIAIKGLKFKGRF